MPASIASLSPTNTPTPAVIVAMSSPTQKAPHPVTDRVREALAITLRGCDELLPRTDWVAKLARSEATGVPLRIKLGLDPTAPDIHVGHTVVLNKMRQLQDIGHTVIFLIGDFTSMIGDPSGRNTTRPPLTREQIEANAQTYYRQASLVLDPAKTEIRYNSEWSDPLGARGMIELASRYTGVALERAIVVEVDGELISRPYVEITLNLLRRFGVAIEREGWQRFTIAPQPGGYRSPGDIHVEGDASSASYFIAAGAIGAADARALRIEGVAVFRNIKNSCS